MANSFLNNAPNIMGLLGLRPRTQNSLLPFAMADAGDEAMFAANPNGTIFPQPQAAPMASPQAAPMTAPGMAQRDRVNPLNVLFRGLAPNLSGALDTERARLQAEADRPAQQARIQAVLSGLNDPREQALFLGLGGEDWQKNVGQQYAPQVVSAGGAQVVNGVRTVDQPTYSETGDTIVSRSSAGVQPVYTRTAPSIAEQTAQDRLAWDRQYGTTNLGISQQNADTSRLNADTTAAAAGSTLSPGQTRFDAYGRPVASVAESTDDPAGTAARRESALSTIQNTRTAVKRALELVGPLSTGALSGLIPGNQWRANLEATADTIEANLSFSALQQMRDASKTGGALGGIAVRELQLLGSTIASLKTSQSPAQFTKNLEIIDQSLDRWEAALNQGGGQSAPPPPPGFVLD